MVFSHVHIDIVGPLPPSRGFSYVLTVIDRTTRWPAAIPISGITTEECARAFCLHWIATFGTPLHITSDRGRQFVSSLWTHLAVSLGSTLHRTTSYHLQSNGLIERFHRSPKTALRARLVGSDWMEHLPWILLALHATVKEDLAAPPAALALRHLPLLPGALISPPSSDPDLPACAPRCHTSTSPATSSIPSTLAKAAVGFLWVDSHRPPLVPPYSGPYL